MAGGKVLFLLDSPSVETTIITMFSYLVRLVGSSIHFSYFISYHCLFRTLHNMDRFPILNPGSNVFIYLYNNRLEG